MNLCACQDRCPCPCQDRCDAIHSISISRGANVDHAMFGAGWVLAQWVDPSMTKGSCTTLQDGIPALKTLHPTSPRNHIQLVMRLSSHGPSSFSQSPMAWTSRFLAPPNGEYRTPEVVWNAMKFGELSFFGECFWSVPVGPYVASWQPPSRSEWKHQLKIATSLLTPKLKIGSSSGEPFRWNVARSNCR